MSIFDQIQEAIHFIRQKTDFQPLTGIVLGTGLGRLTEAVVVSAEIPYAEIPHFAQSTVESHHGKLVFGTLDGHPVVVMAGRFHYYEGWSMQQVVFPVRVLRFLGIKNLLVTNVSGGINPHLRAGDLVIVRDHINLLPENPLRGENDPRLGPRFPDLLHTYDAEFRKDLVHICQKNNIRAVEGVYSALQGPNLETPAEYAFLRTLGSDCTGMSSIPEVLVAKHMGLRIAMVSVVSNVSFPPSAIQETTIEAVIAVARKADEKLLVLAREWVATLEV